MSDSSGQAVLEPILWEVTQNGRSVSGFGANGKAISLPICFLPDWTRPLDETGFARGAHWVFG